jgi:hypothetical protein
MYIIHPGIMESKSDGDLHYISTSQLIKLYKLKYGTFRISRDERFEYYQENDIHLYPNYSGNYNL